MSTDNSAHLITAARRRSSDTAHRAHQALRRLDKDGTPVSYAAIAQAAGVSRSWLYRQPELRTEIDRLRTANQPTDRTPTPTPHRATDQSWRRRTEALLDANRALREDNQKLRGQIAELLGRQRADSRPAS